MPPRLTSLLRSASPFPTIDDTGALHDGLSLRQSPTCSRCRKKECAGLNDEPAGDELVHTRCWRGLSVVQFRWRFGQIVCNGLLVREKNTLGNPDLRRTNRSQRVSWSDLQGFHAAAQAVENEVKAAADSGVNEAIESLHDIRTAVSLVTRHAEAIVMSLPGEDDYEKIESADRQTKSLLKSVQLLRARLNMSSLLSNPQSAAFGNKRSTPVYKIFDRMVRLFAEEAIRKHVSLKMRGSSYSLPECFDSFETIALVLVDNAIKYSCSNSQIEVTVNDVATGVAVTVTSYGPVVPPADRKRIFDRAFRTEAAREFVSSGSGLGLHLAKIVADAHGFSISYSASADSGLGLNTFSFTVP